MSTEKWIDIRNASSASADVYVYGEIGSGGLTSAAFVAALKDVRASTVNVHINSPGGSVFEGLAVYNALHAHPAKIVCRVDGIAASIASVIAMAGDEIVMAENAMMMIHRPSAGRGTGGADEMRSTADVIDKIEGSLVNIYAARSGIAAGEVKSLMAAETWFTAAECLANGLCTRIEKSKGATASFDISTFRNATAALARSVAHVDAVSVANLLRTEFSARLAAKDQQIQTLTAKLQYAEAMSAENLGCAPIPHVVSATIDSMSPADVLAHYRSLKGEARLAFLNTHRAEIWQAKERESHD